MQKKCVVCDAEALYKIKNISEFYCHNCAEEHFGDVEMLVTLEEEARRLKQYIKERLQNEQSD
ncbi:hypothetical protein HOI26_02545 [Candidatus Woesearchaeota archaeon]|jgi:hypothetical protein|nr:hypothetical protein [Candidatus Woesearchaeota archaeon]MBT5739956.1 hypothetical protein [Candidatus Woesearchaeota archaeon]